MRGVVEMKKVNVMGAMILGLGLYGVAVQAADTGINLDTQLLNQKLAIAIASTTSSGPSTVDVQASGPISGDINVRNQLGQCLTLASQIAPGVCVPVGPGSPVSPN